MKLSLVSLHLNMIIVLNVIIFTVPVKSFYETSTTRSRSSSTNHKSNNENRHPGTTAPRRTKGRKCTVSSGSGDFGERSSEEKGMVGSKLTVVTDYNSNKENIPPPSTIAPRGRKAKSDDNDLSQDYVVSSTK